MCLEGLEANQKSTTEVFGTVCEKFSKRRCVTFLAIDQLNPRSEEQQTKLMACVSKNNLVSAKKFSHEDLSAITKSKQFSRAVREENKCRTKTRQSNLKMENNLP